MIFAIKEKSIILTDTIICDPLCENPAKVIFLWFAFFYKRSYGKEHSVKM